jgi:hypothetical protein
MRKIGDEEIKVTIVVNITPVSPDAMAIITFFINAS